MIAQHDIDFTFALPHRAFHRAIGLFSGLRISPAGEVVTQDEWDRRVDDWLPSDQDRAYVRSLMEPVTSPGLMANWIAAPARGINGQPIEFEYTKL